MYGVAMTTPPFAPFPLPPLIPPPLFCGGKNTAVYIYAYDLAFVL